MGGYGCTASIWLSVLGEDARLALQGKLIRLIDCNRAEEGEKASTSSKEGTEEGGPGGGELLEHTYPVTNFVNFPKGIFEQKIQVKLCVGNIKLQTILQDLTFMTVFRRMTL